MTDILSRPRQASPDFRGLAACGGFSYGDVLGAGEGWAKSALFNERARAEFKPPSSPARTPSPWASATAAR
jgi:phosphoribosylformylglycinamidine synthase